MPSFFSRPASGVALALALLAAPVRAQRPITLQQAIQMALEQGRAAKAAEATRDAARYRDRAFFSRLLPQLSLGGTVPSYNRSIIQVVQPDGSVLFKPQDQTNTSLTMTMTQKLPVLGGDLFVTSGLAKLQRSGTTDVTTWSSTPLSFGLRQDLFKPNTAGWDRREQFIRSEVSERQFLESREDISLQATNLFFDVYSARAELANAVKNAAVNDTLYNLNKGRYEVGRIGENDLLQNELALLRARNRLDGARLEYDRASAALRLGLSLPTGVPLDLEVTDMVPRFEADTAQAVAEALRNRASVSDAELQDVQAKRRITEARLANGIGATINASYGYNATADTRRDVYQDLQEARTFSMSVQLPLWQWGARKETVEAAKADAERTANTTQTALQQTAQDAHFAALQLAQARRNLELSAKADTVAGKRYDVAYNRYVIGRITIDNLYIAQNEKDAALASYVQSLRGYWQAYFRLRRMTLFDFEKGEKIR
ncbi:MAG: TolC family protein [Gemmatimonadales bacterium]|nr:TolC family protein [Gemmatimonadales bacterium]